MDRGKLVETIAPYSAWKSAGWTVDAILAEIKAQGYVIVPREPTEAMVEAGAYTDYESFIFQPWDAKDCWERMVRAAMLSALEDQ